MGHPIRTCIHSRTDLVTAAHVRLAVPAALELEEALAVVSGARTLSIEKVHALRTRSSRRRLPRPLRKRDSKEAALGAEQAKAARRGEERRGEATRSHLAEGVVEHGLDTKLLFAEQLYNAHEPIGAD